MYFVYIWIMHKECFKCKRILPIEDFYKHKKMGDGHLNKCKSCTRNDVKIRFDHKIKNEPDFVDSERIRARDKYHRLYRETLMPALPQCEDGSGYKIRPTFSPEQLLQNLKDAKKAYTRKYPEKAIAKNLSQRVKAKVKGNQMHHWSYNVRDAKNVIELTVKDHSKIHRFLVYDPERFMFRRYDTNELLDTRERHEQFIKYVLENLE